MTSGLILQSFKSLQGNVEYDQSLEGAHTYFKNPSQTAETLNHNKNNMRRQTAELRRAPNVCPPVIW